MDEVIAQAVEWLLHAGWRGALVALVLVIVLAAMKQGAPAAYAALGAAWAKREPQTVADENGPQSEGTPLHTDPNRNFDEGGEG